MLKYNVFLESDMRHNIQASRASTTITSYVLSDIRNSTIGGSTNIDIKIKNVSEYFKLILKFQLEGFFSLNLLQNFCFAGLDIKRHQKVKRER